jgi:hypothetical protein
MACPGRPFWRGPSPTKWWLRALQGTRPQVCVERACSSYCRTSYWTIVGFLSVAERLAQVAPHRSTPTAPLSRAKGMPGGLSLVRHLHSLFEEAEMLLVRPVVASSGNPQPCGLFPRMHHC